MLNRLRTLCLVLSMGDVKPDCAPSSRLEEEEEEDRYWLRRRRELFWLGVFACAGVSLLEADVKEDVREGGEGTQGYEEGDEGAEEESTTNVGLDDLWVIPIKMPVLLPANATNHWERECM
jgi:hypothetical protein